jgi:hypothetical protein
MDCNTNRSPFVNALGNRLTRKHSIDGWINDIRRISFGHLVVRPKIMCEFKVYSRSVGLTFPSYLSFKLSLNRNVKNLFMVYK